MSSLIQKPKKNWKGIPPLGAGDDEVKEWLLKRTTQTGKVRRYNMWRFARNLAFYVGRHWIDTEGAMAKPNANGSYSFGNIKRKSDASFKLPVHNLVGDGIDNEVARLGRKEYVPETIPDRSVPEWEAAARLGKAVLLNDLQEQRFPDMREAWAFDLMTYGTCIGRSIWDETITKPAVLASKDAVSCTGCSNKFASAKIPRQFASLGIMSETGPVQLKHAHTLAPVASDDEDPNRPEELEMKLCPTCDEPKELSPYQPSVEECAEGGPIDMFGRPLGQVVSAGEGLIEVVSLQDFFPENGGVAVEPKDMLVFTQRSVRTMEWVCTHLPDIADSIEPDDPAEILRQHPSLGDRAMAGTSSSSADPDVYDHHVLVTECFVKSIPLPGLEDGRRMVLLKDRVALNDELMIPMDMPDGSQKKISRVRYEIARCKRVPGDFWGRTPVDDAIPLNRRLNELDAQIVDLRYRGMPFFAVAPGDEIFDRKDVTGAMRVVEVETVDGQRLDLSASLVNANPITGNSYLAERDKIVEAIKECLGPKDVEQGINETGVKTVGQLAILNEEAAVKRGPRERALTGMFEGLWQHHLEATWAFKRTTGELEEKTATGEYERNSYESTDLTGGTRVKVEAEGTFDKSIMQAQGAAQAASMNLYDITDPVQKDKLLDLMHLPKVKESDSIQIKRANQAFSTFLKEHDEIPVFDDTVQAPLIWYQVLGELWQGDEAMELRDQAKWDDVLRRLAGWPRKLQEAEAQDEAARAIYEGFPPEQWPQIYEMGQQKAQEQNQAQAEAAGMVNAPAPPEQQIPQPPASGQFLPEDLAERLLAVWRPMLMDLLPDPALMAQVAAMPGVAQDNARVGMIPEGASDLEALLKMYALIQQCRLLAQGVQGAVAAGAPTVAPPGTDAASQQAAVEPQAMPA